MKVLVTGASGFIGSHLVEMLLERGADVRVLIRKTSNIQYLENRPVEKCYGSLEDLESLKKATKGVEIVYHLAGQVEAKFSVSFHQTNTKGSENLLEACLAQDVVPSFVFVSSLAAGGPMKSQQPRSETMEDSPVSAYGKSKWAAEKFLESYRGRIPICIIRPPIVYGSRDQGLLKVCKLAGGFVLPIPRGSGVSGQKLYSSIYVIDLCKGILLASESISKRKGLGETDILERYYLTSEELLSFEQMLNVILRAMKRKPVKLLIPAWFLSLIHKILFTLGRLPLPGAQVLFPDKLNEIIPDYWICSSEKARKELGFEARFSFEKAMPEVIEWYRKEAWLS